MKESRWTGQHGERFVFWSQESIQEAWLASRDLKQVADQCRLNALSAIQCAGSGHIGTSLSSLDIMVAVRRFLGGEEFLTQPADHIFFSSKGHDAPAFYAVMHACGQLEDADLFTLRRLGGLPGHPETITPGVATNTGSLGMGISKAKGFVKANRLLSPGERKPVVVMLGDGELDEGQIWESMPGAARDGFHELVAIVDANAIQSDTWTDRTLPLGDVQKRVEGSGWNFIRCQGNNPSEVLNSLESATKSTTPTLIWAETTKGSGVPWMEEFPAEGEYYKFHSGALDPVLYETASEILLSAGHRRRSPEVQSGLSDRPEFDSLTPRARAVSMLSLWEEMLCELMQADPSVVALDGDLSYDTGTHLARHRFPDRYIQSGIAEQDMVSMAGTLALSGYTPIVHSFSTFLTMRATEQIFNNATEYSRVIYMGFLSGLVPSAPGFSHQAVTDVGIMTSIPGMRLFEPACSAELRWAAEAALGHPGPSFIRMGGLSPTPVSGDPAPVTRRVEGSDVALITSGPLLTHSALTAAELLNRDGVSASVYSIVDAQLIGEQSLLTEIGAHSAVFVLENHNPALSRYELLRARLGNSEVLVRRLGLTGVPANGQPDEVLAHHGLDSAGVANAVKVALGLYR